MKNKNKLMLTCSGAAVVVGLITFSTAPVVNIQDETILVSKSGHNNVSTYTPSNSLKNELKQEKAMVVAETPRKFTGKAFAPSLEGTEIDGRLRADTNGNLIVDLEVRDLFDYFLNAVADVSPEIAIEQLEKLASESLPESSVKQVMALLEDYIAYKELAIELMKQDLVPPEVQTASYQLKMLESSFQQLKEVRRQTMSAEAVKAFFYLEEAYGEYTLASIQIQNNEALSPAEKNMYLELQRQQLPEIIQRTESRMLADTRSNQEVNEILTSKQSDAQVTRALADKGLPSEAIASAMLYRENQRQFEVQYDLYQNDRRILLNSGLSVLDQEKEIEHLRQKYFSDEQFLAQAKVKGLRS